MTFGIVALAVCVGLVLVVLPRIVFPLAETGENVLDRTVAGFVLITAVVVAAMYAFGTFGMLETLTIVAALALTWWGLKGRHRPPGRFARFAKRVFAFFDRSEVVGGGQAARDLSREAQTGVARRLSERTRRPVNAGAIVQGAAVVAVLAVASWLRFERSLTHIELVPQDSYLALVATKFLNKGGILGESIYPQAVYMWMSLLDRVYPLDTYTFVRFAGPAMSTLELIGLYWATSRVTRSRSAGLLTASLFGLFAGHPHLLVFWDRQIGSMTQEFATALAVVSLAFGARYAADHRGWSLALACAALYTAVAGHAMVIPMLAIGFAAIVAVGALTGSWTRRSLSRLVVAGLVATAAGNYYFILGFWRRLPLAQSFELYSPGNAFGFLSPELAQRAPVGNELANNPIYLWGTLGCILAIVAGASLAFREQSRPRGRTLATFAAGMLGMLLFFDLVAVRFGFLFVTRQAHIAGTVATIGIGLGLGALVLVATELAAGGPEPGAGAEPEPVTRTLGRTTLELSSLVVVALIVAMLWPTYWNGAVARRGTGPSGYPQATEVSLDVINREEPLRFTFVGLSEQYQEAVEIGFFVEAWVFARDITFSQARDPSFEIPIPTNQIYIFAEKVPFPGPQQQPFGPTEEYYRNADKRRRIMHRIVAWCEEYRRVHRDMDVVHDDEELRVYRVKRTVDVTRADATPVFKDYTWRPGELFSDDADVTADVVEPRPVRTAAGTRP